MAGYSGTPLAKKLGIKPGSKLRLVDAPPGFLSLLDPLPPDVIQMRSINADTDLVHLFVTSAKKLDAELKQIRTKMRDDAVVWVSWPKRASQVPTDITEDAIRDVALPLGLVDIKVCAVDDVWSGLKLMIRKELRASPSRA